MLKDVHGTKIKIFGIVLAISAGLFFVMLVLTPIVLSWGDKVMTDALKTLEESEEYMKEHEKYMKEYNKTYIVEMKEEIEKQEKWILGYEDDIKFYKGLINNEKQRFERYEIRLKENEKDLKSQGLKVEKAKARVDATDVESKIYKIELAGYQNALDYFDQLKKRRSEIEEHILKAKEKIKDHDKRISKFEERIKGNNERISQCEIYLASSEQDLRERSLKETSHKPAEEEKSIEELIEFRDENLYTPTNIGILIFHSLSMFLFLVISKSWIAKDPFSKSVIFSFRLLGILWIGHAIFTLVYFVMVALDPDKLQSLSTQVSTDSQLLPNFGNMDSLIAGLLFLCLSFIIDHGSQMLEESRLTV